MVLLQKDILHHTIQVLKNAQAPAGFFLTYLRRFEALQGREAEGVRLGCAAAEASVFYKSYRYNTGSY